jgi:hypothetical protein
LKKLLSKIGITFFRLSLLLAMVGMISNSVTGGANTFSDVVQHILYFTVPVSALFFAKYRISLKDIAWSIFFFTLMSTIAITIAWVVSLIVWGCSILLYPSTYKSWPGAISYVPWWVIGSLVVAEVLVFRSRTLRKKLFD